MLLLKLTLVPAIMLLISLATRCWGGFVGGMLSGLPVIAAPITLLLALEHGSAFAVESAYATLLGVVALSSFCFVYAWSATRYGWWRSLAVSWCIYFLLAFGGAFGLSGMPELTMPGLRIEPFVISVLVLLILLLLRCNLPKVNVRKVGGVLVSNNEIIARMIASAILVVCVTGLASILGPSFSGVLATFPIAATILAVFTHRYYGKSEVAILMKGFMLGTCSLIFFYFFLILLSSYLGFYISFTVSLLAVVAIQTLRIGLSRKMKR